MKHIVAQSLCLGGFVCLAIATTRIQRDVLGMRFLRRKVIILRSAGAVLLFVALLWLADWQGLALGLVMVSGHTSAAAALVYVALIALSRRRAQLINHNVRRPMHFYDFARSSGQDSR